VQRFAGEKECPFPTMVLLKKLLVMGDHATPPSDGSVGPDGMACLPRWDLWRGTGLPPASESLRGSFFVL
jgi:hypothetical protein